MLPTAFEGEVGVFVYLPMSVNTVAIYHRFSADLKPRIVLNECLRLPVNREMLAHILSVLVTIDRGVKWESTQIYPVVTTISSDGTLQTRMNLARKSPIPQVIMLNRP